jgi:pilus assembly protein CpaF
VVSVAEVLGMVEGEIALQEIFAYRQVGVTPDGRAVGYHTATGTRSNFLAHFVSNGVQLPDSTFAPMEQPPAERLY